MSSNISGTILTYVNISNVITGVTGATTTDQAALGMAELITFANGTGANQIQNHFYFTETLASTTRTFDLTALPGATGTFALTQLKVLMLGSINMTLPTLAAVDPGRIFTVKKISGSNTMTLSASGGNTIDGSATQTATANYSFFTVCGSSLDGDTPNDWSIIAKG